MKDIQKVISPFIEGQFPSHYLQRPGIEVTESERAVIVDFMEAFYEYLETYPDSAFYQSRRMFDYRDIDTTLDSFIRYFRKKYLENLPYDFAPTDEFVVKKIIDLYRAKGSEKAVKLLIRLLFNADSEVYLPGEDVLRPSDSEWKEPKYLEVTRSTRNIEFLFGRVTGSSSGTSAFVESVVTKRVNGKYIDLLYISDLKGGDFQTGEFITNDGNVINAPTLIGSLSAITVDFSEAGYSIGDRLDVVTDNGVNGEAKVTKVFDVNDAVDFTIRKSGFGYSVEDSEIYIATATLFVDNANLVYNQFENVTQTLSEYDVADTSALAIDDSVTVYDSADTEVGTGFVVAKTDTSVTVETVTGDLKRYQTLNLQNANLFIEDEKVKQGSNVSLGVNNLSGSFTNGETILQRELQNGAYVNIAYGELASVGGSTFAIENAWGEFLDGKTIEGLTSGETAEITGVTVSSNGALGTIVSSNSSAIEVSPEYGTFDTTNDIRGEQSKNINTVTSASFFGAEKFEVDSTSYTVTDYLDVSASGILVGQLNNRIGLYGNNTPFYFTPNSNNVITSDGNVSKELLRVGNGSGASFKIGTLNEATKETVTIKTDIIGDDNIAGVPYLDVVIGTAEDSGVGRLDANVAIVSGGSGYSNSDTITFSGGGYSNGTPIIVAEAQIVTDGSGVITDINVIDQGQGYYNAPSYAISGSGVGADLTFSIEYGYGFPKLPYGGFEDIIDDVLSSKQVTIGEIATLSEINRGSGYDTTLFTKVINRDILNFDIEDVTLKITLGVGTLIPGEVITAASGAEGRVETVTGDTINVKNLSFNTRFVVGDTITGGSTNSTATITQITQRFGEDDMAENAFIDSRVAFAAGIIEEVGIVNSGYGYKDLEIVNLYDKGTTTLAANGTISVAKQGVSEGFWKTRTSHLNEKFLHDNRFYQEYSYQVQAEVSFDKYEEIVRNAIHVAGTELFGETHLSGVVNTAYTTSSTMSRGQAVEYDTEVIESFNIANTLFTDIYVLEPTNSGVGRLSTEVVIVDGGSGYSNTSTVTFTGGGEGNTTPTDVATASIVTDGSGVITDFNIISRGSGYVTEPTITISDGSNANVQIDIQYGYGFVKSPYSNINTIINQALGFGDIVFEETSVLF